MEAQEKDPNALKVVYKRGAYDRMIAGESWLIMLLYSIKEQFLSNLKASDDYGSFDDIVERQLPIPPEFSESICRPSLAKKWGFGYSDLLNKGAVQITSLNHL